MPQHLPHVFPQIARSKNEEQLLQGLSPERLQEASRTHSAIRYWTCCPRAKATALRVCSGWGQSRFWGERSSGDFNDSQHHYSFMALIYWTDRDTENTNKHTKTQDQTFTLTEWELWSSRHKEGRCTCSTITMGTSSVQVFTKFITMWMPVGALSHFLVLKMWGAHLNASPVKPSEPFWRKNVCGESQVWHSLLNRITNTMSLRENTLCAAWVNNGELRQG